MFIAMQEEHNERAMQRSLRAAFQRLYHRGLYGQWVAQMIGRPHTLLNLADTKTQHLGQTRLHGGIKLVPLHRIRGSEGRCNDFDAEFRPLKEFNDMRWVSVACAQLSDVPLPLIELIQVDDIYYVRDGHHRISVARWLGQQEIEAEVTVWRTHDLDTQPKCQAPALPMANRLQQPIRALTNQVMKTGERLLAIVRQKGQLRVGHTLTQSS